MKGYTLNIEGKKFRFSDHYITEMMDFIKTWLLATKEQTTSIQITEIEQVSQSKL